MARKTAIDKLAANVGKILEEYAGEISDNLDAITQQMGQKGAQALRQSSKEKLKQHTGEYAKGWKYEFRQTKRMKMGTTTIYNEHYSLPHLLEHGHAKRGGGRVPGHPHIAPVADELVETYQREVIEKL